MTSITTNWQSLSEMNLHLKQLDQKINGGNYWDKGNWINSVDGRWHKGIAEYKINYGPVPNNKGYWWYWWFNQDQKSFQNHLHRLADEDFTLVHYQSFERPGGEIRYQGVWQKLIPNDN